MTSAAPRLLLAIADEALRDELARLQARRGWQAGRQATGYEKLPLTEDSLGFRSYRPL